ncbi:ATP-binding protein [Actinacidiphila acididurans]|uniref:ATP-binding protein n=1 Tax=Actinacidiphila acididurans TaxID=2784346 RepID=A0ABS2U0J0_9ACTN|nr:ATP-binding protein [Actinacidiphila acididurans]MBM9508055.1 ATP-binding protein [Actinacidiphila acididurans]
MLPVSGAPGEERIVAHRWANYDRNVARVRHELRLQMVKWHVPEGVWEPAVLVLSELFTNSLRHARNPEGHQIETRFELQPRGVRIEVHDANAAKPELREASEDEESGRGLTLVDCVTSGRWGVSDRDGIGKLVWAECVEGNDAEVSP